MKILISFLIYLLSFNAVADNKKCLNAISQLDKNVENICRKVLNDSQVSKNDKTVVYISLASYYINKNQYKLANEQLDLAFKSNPIILENGIYRYNWLRSKGLLLYSKEDYENALTYLLQASEIAQIIGDNVFLSQSYNDLGATYLDINNYSKAIEFLQKSLKINNADGKDFLVAYSLANIAEVYLAKKEYDKALDYFNEAISSHKRVLKTHPENPERYDRPVAKIHLSQAKTYMEMKDYSQAKIYFEKAVALFEKYDLARDKIEAMSLLGKLYLQQNLIDKALASLLEARDLELKLESQDNYDLKKNLLEAYIASENWEEAKKIAFEGLGLAQQSNNLLHQTDFYELLANLYQKKGDFSEANAYLKLYIKSKEKLLSKKYDNYQGKLLSSIELNRRQREIAKLEKQKSLDKFKNKQQQLLFIAIGILLLLAIAYLLFKLKQKNKRKRRILTDQDLHLDQLKKLSIDESRIKHLFNGIHVPFICFESSGKIVFRASVLESSLTNSRLFMQKTYPDIWKLVVTHLNDDEKIEKDLFIDIDLQEDNMNSVWVHQMPHLDDMLVCLLINNENKSESFQIAENIRNYTIFKYQLNSFLRNTQDFSVSQVLQLAPVILAMKSINNKTKLGNVEDLETADLKEKLVDLMLTCIDVWQKNSTKTKIDLAQESGFWLVGVEEGQLRTRTLDKYLDRSKIPNNPRWKQVLKTAHYILSNCNLNISERQLLNEKTNEIKQIIHQRSLGQ